MDFDKLDALLKERGISRRALALAVGINENTIGTAFKRRSGLSSEDLLKIARYLDVSPYVLIDWGEESDWTDVDDSILQAGGAYELRKVAEGLERQIIQPFNKLNTTGKMEAIKRVEELTEIPRYTEKPNNTKHPTTQGD